MRPVRVFLEKVGHVQSTLLLSIVYLALWMPVGLIARISADWLRRRPPVRTQWWPRSSRLNDPRHVKEPF